jgi:hypothetical protein
MKKKDSKLYIKKILPHTGILYPDQMPGSANCCYRHTASAAYAAISSLITSVVDPKIFFGDPNQDPNFKKFQSDSGSDRSLECLILIGTLGCQIRYLEFGSGSD